jgi:hypothetical protein
MSNSTPYEVANTGGYYLKAPTPELTESGCLIIGTVDCTLDNRPRREAVVVEMSITAGRRQYLCYTQQSNIIIATADILKSTHGSSNIQLHPPFNIISDIDSENTGYLGIYFVLAFCVAGVNESFARLTLSKDDKNHLNRILHVLHQFYVLGPLALVQRGYDDSMTLLILEAMAGAQIPTFQMFPPLELIEQDWKYYVHSVDIGDLYMPYEWQNAISMLKLLPLIGLDIQDKTGPSATLLLYDFLRIKGCVPVGWVLIRDFGLYQNTSSHQAIESHQLTRRTKRRWCQKQ